MLLDEVFEPEPSTESIIIRKNGKLFMKLIPTKTETEPVSSLKPLFPIDKERK